MLDDIAQQTLFDYGSLDTDTRTFVQEKAQAIHARLKRTAEDVIAIGLDLTSVKSRLGHGQFENWIRSEFEMSYSASLRFMQVAKRFDDKNTNLVFLPTSVLYELAAPSTPDVIVEMVEAGTIPPTLTAIREVKRDFQESEPAQKNFTPQQFFDEVVPGFTGWQETQPEAQQKHVTPETLSLTPDDLPPTWNHVNGVPFNVPLPDGKPAIIPEEWKLPSFARGGVPAALQMSESNEWYTPSPYVEAAREVMGGIDLDPASNEYANSKVVRAATYYDIHTNGLDKEWTGRVWINPPYGREAGDSNQETWSRRLIEQFEAGITTEAVLLVNAVTDRKWFQPLWNYLICFTDHRIRFYNEETEAGQPTHGNALIYLGPKDKRNCFKEVFRQFGPIVARIS